MTQPPPPTSKSAPQTEAMVSQGFTTGSITRSGPTACRASDVNIEGSDVSNGDFQVPDDPSSVSVAVHADSSGKPGAKLFDLVSPDAFRAGPELLRGAARRDCWRTPPT